MDFPGNNMMNLCGQALMNIIEKSLNENRVDIPPIRVTQLIYQDLGYNITFTTDKEQK
jgi:hypothetical protein